ncbi:MAG: hypothetical protein EXR33_05250 [Betaproteobacteria bacterium]|nr:hypothetical protein [Betaproteobacteria bacterium]
MKLYGFWRSLATYRVRAALGLKGIAAEEVSIDILKGKQFTDEYKALNPQSVVPTALRIYGECMKLPAFERAHPSRQPEAPK